MITRKSSIGDDNVSIIHDYKKGEKIRIKGFSGGTGVTSAYLDGKDTVIDYRGDTIGIIRDFQFKRRAFGNINIDYMDMFF